jgi:hypothetical protein
LINNARIANPRFTLIVLHKSRIVRRKPSLGQMRKSDYSLLKKVGLKPPGESSDNL